MQDGKKLKNQKMKKILLAALLMSVLVSCKNQDWEFPDFPYQTVYFAYQAPIRTITLGEDIFDTSLDNAYKCKIMATAGGAYTTKADVSIDVAIDNTLAQNLLFSGGGDNIIPMPASYYSLASDRIIIPKGEITGGVEVQLTDAFFADPLAIKNTYVIPLKMTKVTNADSIHSTKSYVLYALKYVNPWHGNYLRRGKDVITGKSGSSIANKTVVRHKEFVEKDELSTLSTQSLSSTRLPLVFPDANGQNINCELVLTFDNAGNCNISSGSNGITATGKGSFVKKGEKNSWGAKDRDAIYVNYEIDMPQMRVASTDTLVLRDRGVTMATFSPVSK